MKLKSTGSSPELLLLLIFGEGLAISGFGACGDCVQRFSDQHSLEKNIVNLRSHICFVMPKISAPAAMDQN